ncbi:selenium-dependent molybdenum cofactor biosynthesis protein YqeB [Aeromonas veronii]|uniref:selenium-dependent molybdenum cofactor biosynthesis protein YqeB n=1 Tax=Aeromonas veronii TaxID=654 RepID=UPI002363A13A|nr:selenium-dependent molybdenum cofactor biosynthesis protein YqeB [Aeromonas veronii]MDD1846173.1 EF2563 family selenium-dependent molybdenum hydroxylase system protein [Aeromonas veronii]
MNLFAHAARLEQENTPFAMAQIIESRGSTPRHQAQMLVMADGQILGTIGGGMIERLVIEEAMAAIAERKPRIFHGRMARNGEHAVGSDCGGAMSVYIDVYGLRPRLVLIGAGHVNRALAHAAAPLGFDIHVGDCFEGSLNPDHFPVGTHLKQADTISAVIEALAIEPANFVIIATNHQDKEALERLINRPLAYLGLLASKRKVQTFTQALRQQGVSQEQLQQLHAPIGYNIGAETPEEIAISILAELLQVKNGKSGGLMQDDVRLKRDQLVVMRGSGDIATGVALRLHNAGFKVVMLDLDKPTVIRRTVAFAQGMFDGETCVEGVRAKRVESVEQAFEQLDRGVIPLLVDPDCATLAELKPRYLVDAILAKQNLGTHKEMAPITVALGPGFEAGRDCDAVIETNRGHHLGRVIYQGPAQPNTGIPGVIEGHSARRVVRAPAPGVMKSLIKLGDLVQEGDVIAHVGDTPIIAPLSGMVRGLLSDGIEVPVGFKIGDIDPRGERADATTVSDKARAIGGAVLEAMMHLAQRR